MKFNNKKLGYDFFYMICLSCTTSIKGVVIIIDYKHKAHDLVKITSNEWALSIQPKIPKTSVGTEHFGSIRLEYLRPRSCSGFGNHVSPLPNLHMIVWALYR